MNGRPSAPRRQVMPSADAPMAVAAAALHEMYLSLQVGGFTKGEAIAFVAHYVAAREGKTEEPGT